MSKAPLKPGDIVVISEDADLKNRGLTGTIDWVNYNAGTAHIFIRNTTGHKGLDRYLTISIDRLELPDVRHDTKLSNPKDIIGSTKPGLTSLSMPVLFEMGAGMDDGAYKYGRHNYRAVGVRHSIYVNAAMRHLAAFWEGEDIDPDSGLSHITKVMTCLHVLRDSQIMGNDVDDRPIRAPDDWMERARAHTDDVISRHPNPVPPFLNKP